MTNARDDDDCCKGHLCPHCGMLRHRHAPRETDHYGPAVKIGARLAVLVGLRKPPRPTRARKRINISV